MSTPCGHDLLECAPDRSGVQIRPCLRNTSGVPLTREDKIGIYWLRDDERLSINLLSVWFEVDDETIRKILRAPPQLTPALMIEARCQWQARFGSGPDPLDWTSPRSNPNADGDAYERYAEGWASSEHWHIQRAYPTPDEVLLDFASWTEFLNASDDKVPRYAVRQPKPGRALDRHIRHMHKTHKLTERLLARVFSMPIPTIERIVRNDLTRADAIEAGVAHAMRFGQIPRMRDYRSLGAVDGADRADRLLRSARWAHPSDPDRWGPWPTEHEIKRLFCGWREYQAEVKARLVADAHARRSVDAGMDPDATLRLRSGAATASDLAEACRRYYLWHGQFPLLQANGTLAVPTRVPNSVDQWLRLELVLPIFGTWARYIAEAGSTVRTHRWYRAERYVVAPAGESRGHLSFAPPIPPYHENFGGEYDVLFLEAMLMTDAEA